MTIQPSYMRLCLCTVPRGLTGKTVWKVGARIPNTPQAGAALGHHGEAPPLQSPLPDAPRTARGTRTPPPRSPALGGARPGRSRGGRSFPGRRRRLRARRTQPAGKRCWAGGRLRGLVHLPAGLGKGEPGSRSTRVPSAPNQLPSLEQCALELWTWVLRSLSFPS